MTIKQRLNDITATISKTVGDLALAAHKVELIAVSKTYPPEVVVEALEAGHRQFGENRVQEAKEKWPELLKRYPDTKLHLIGRLQTNKVAEAINIFHTIHTLDSEKLADEIAKQSRKAGKNPEILIQVNTGEEEQKGGVLPKETDELVLYCRNLGLNLMGLMCIPPVEEEPSPHFALLRKIAERNNLKNLSMGMSGDYEKAIRMGATHIRVGSAIFGERDK